MRAATSAADTHHEHDGSAAGHDHGHHHAHAHNHAGAGFRAAFFLTILVLVVEVSCGLLAHSLALLSDGGHVLTDVVALALAWFASAQAGRPADASKTYGYHRTGILAALANAVTLIAIVAGIAYEAVRRFQHPEHVAASVMLPAAVVGIVVNLYIASRLHGESPDNVNVRAALLHVLGDAGASAGVILAALIIAFTGWSAADPAISLLIALLIAQSAWRVLRETLAILMEAAPAGLDTGQLAREMAAVAGIAEVHDLHVWSIAGGVHALSAHMLLRDDCRLSNCDSLLDRVNALLADRYRITHSTIQFEHDCCGRHEGSRVFCTQAGHERTASPCVHQREA
jgi:cobalt-zinc-cadmium efflux system protein